MAISIIYQLTLVDKKSDGASSSPACYMPLNTSIDTWYLFRPHKNAPSSLEANFFSAPMHHLSLQLPSSACCALLVIVDLLCLCLLSNQSLGAFVRLVITVLQIFFSAMLWSQAEELCLNFFCHIQTGMVSCFHLICVCISKWIFVFMHGLQHACKFEAKLLGKQIERECVHACVCACVYVWMLCVRCSVYAK